MAPGRFGTVRPRVQIPGPRPVSYSKSAISRVVRSRRITAGSQFPWELSQPKGAAVAVGGGSELARQQSMAPRRLRAEDATVRTVRHPVRKSKAPSTPVCPRRTGRDRGRRVICDLCRGHHWRAGGGDLRPTGAGLAAGAVLLLLQRNLGSLIKRECRNPGDPH